MNSANATEQEMKYLIDKYSGDNINQLFSTGLLSHPFLASGPRQHMFSVHYQQHIMLKDPETPRCFTGWENQFGKYISFFPYNDSAVVSMKGFKYEVEDFSLTADVSRGVSNELMDEECKVSIKNNDYIIVMETRD